MAKGLKPTKPGAWYFFVVCPLCNKPIIFREAPSPEMELRPFVTGVKLACDGCGKTNTFRASQVRRSQVIENK